MIANGHKVSFWGDENAQIDCGDGFLTLVNILKDTEMCTYTGVNCMECELHFNKVVLFKLMKLM